MFPFCNNTGDFAFPRFTEIKFPEWQACADSAGYPKTDDTDDDYLLNRVARLFCRAFDRLVEQRSFAQLRLARPTLLGFEFHDHDQYVVDLLNLPDSA